MSKNANHKPRPCPCGRPAIFEACCGPYIDGSSVAPTAEALMRSRYTAYTLRNTGYLLATWHASTRPPTLDSSDNPRWSGLTIERTASTGANTATVEFIACYRDGGRTHRLHEVSRLLCEDGQWKYVDGEFRPD